MDLCANFNPPAICFLPLQDPHKTSLQVGHSRGKANYPSFRYPRLKIHVNDTSKPSRLCKIRTNMKLLQQLFRNFSKVKVRGFSRNWLNGQRTERGNSLHPFYQNMQSSFLYGIATSRSSGTNLIYPTATRSFLRSIPSLFWSMYDCVSFED